MTEDQKQPVANTTENQNKSEQQNVATNGQTTNTEQKPKTLGDILTGEGTNLVYVSGMLQGQQINCEGPIEYTRKLDHPQWPFIPALPQYDPSKCKTPKFDWGKGEWVDESEEAKEKELNDLKQAVKTLQNEGQDTEGLSQKIDAIQQGQTQTTAVLGQLLPAVQELTKFAANLQNQESTQTQGNTAKEEGNK
ncbi:hypothetical protein [uncultured Lactobacillus sp.]|uniref:hypothetical protein n=1 Tax=uncultured Lactobacillus sp. TaxID=153152 RepID=UPI0026237796|nr:hypothetical protein [uncultured Lactobacillus sp.]